MHRIPVDSQVWPVGAGCRSRSRRRPGRPARVVDGCGVGLRAAPERELPPGCAGPSPPAAGDADDDGPPDADVADRRHNLATPGHRLLRRQVRPASTAYRRGTGGRVAVPPVAGDHRRPGRTRRRRSLLVRRLRSAPSPHGRGGNAASPSSAPPTAGWWSCRVATPGNGSTEPQTHVTGTGHESRLTATPGEPTPAEPVNGRSAQNCPLPAVTRGGALGAQSRSQTEMGNMHGQCRENLLNQQASILGREDLKLFWPKTMCPLIAVRDREER